MFINDEITSGSEIARHSNERARWRNESSDNYSTWLLNRAEAAEARAAELLESNRELSEALEIVKAELRELRLSIIESSTS